MSHEASSINQAPKSPFFDRMNVSEKVAIGVAVTALVVTILGSIAFGVHFPHVVSFMNNFNVQIGLTAGGGAVLLSSLTYLAVQQCKMRGSGENSENIVQKNDDESKPENTKSLDIKKDEQKSEPIPIPIPTPNSGIIKDNGSKPETIHSTPQKNPDGERDESQILDFEFEKSPPLHSSFNASDFSLKVDEDKTSSSNSPSLNSSPVYLHSPSQNAEDFDPNQSVEDGHLLKTEWYSTGDQPFGEKITDDGNCAYDAFIKSYRKMDVYPKFDDVKKLENLATLRLKTNEWLINKIESEEVQKVVHYTMIEEIRKNIEDIGDSRKSLLTAMSQPLIDLMDEEIGSTTETINLLKQEKQDVAELESNLQFLEGEKEKLQKLVFYDVNLKFLDKFGVDIAREILFKDFELEKSLKLEQEKLENLNNEALSFEERKGAYVEYLERCKDNTPENRIFANTAQYHAFANMFSFPINLEGYVDGDPEYYAQVFSYGDKNASETVRFLCKDKHIELLLPR